jgi:hypothetical protein
MSRAYRVRVQESLRRIITAEDHVSTQLELLALLPAEQMADLLAAELERGGFEKNANKLTRKHKDVIIEIDPTNAIVTVRAQSSTEVAVKGERAAILNREAGRDQNKKAEDATREGLRKDLHKKVDDKKAALETEVTQKLQGSLADIRRELDQVINRVTAEALKKKAAQMGRITELSEDKASGSLTIVLEV